VRAKSTRGEEKRGQGALGALIPFALVLVVLGGVALYGVLSPSAQSVADFDPNALPATAAGPAKELPDGCGPVASMETAHRICQAVSDFIRITSKDAAR